MEQLSFNQTLSQNPVPVALADRSLKRRSRLARPVAIHSQERPLRAPETPDAPAREPQGNVTEIILPEGQVENMQLLLPMLTQLNQERRWLAWIDPPQALMQKWQQTHGIVAGEILVLRSNDQFDAQELAERALRAGTCHAVVMWTAGTPGTAAMDRLQQASAKGESHGVVLRQR
ncbi:MULTISPECIES: cell division inhibitor SulA [Marinobacter]|uniref:cell division inhibitor SulA n=1 Tax=Marinobacter TaxID=2742 RepID=UPI000DAB7827|nr:MULTISPECIES: SulA-like leucine-rich domain-containing protein [Marinobacter]